MSIGPKRCAGYFLNPQKARASACLFTGIFLVFVGWPVFGIALECFGILNLFGNMFPFLWTMVKNMPIISSIVKDSGNGSMKRRPPERNYDDFDDRQSYEDDREYKYDDNPDDSRFY